MPALWAIVTEAIYNVQESNNFPRTYAPYFSMSIKLTCFLHKGLIDVAPPVSSSVSVPLNFELVKLWHGVAIRHVLCATHVEEEIPPSIGGFHI